MPSGPVSFLPSDATPVSFPPSDATPVFSPPQQCPLGPSPPHLLSGTAPFPLPSTVPLSPVSSPLPSTLPPLPGTCSPGAPFGSSIPALSQRPFGSPAPALSSPQHLPPFWHRSTKQDQTEGCSVLFDRTKGLRSAMFSRTKGHDRTEGLCLAKIGSNRGPSFGPVWPNSAGREGALGSGAGKLGRNAGREHVSKSGGRVLRKRKEMGERGRCRKGERGWYRKGDV